MKYERKRTYIYTPKSIFLIILSFIFVIIGVILVNYNNYLGILFVFLAVIPSLIFYKFYYISRWGDDNVDDDEMDEEEVQKEIDYFMNLNNKPRDCPYCGTQLKVGSLKCHYCDQDFRLKPK